MSQDIIKQYYATEVEKHRLDSNPFKLEGIRTREIISRYLAGGKKKIIDIGGGAGYYAFWLAQQGHEVHMVDLSPKNIELAKTYGQENNIQLHSISQGDATELKVESGQFDIALMLGPLYHLTEKEKRIKALEEAKRVLSPNGVLICAIISRYASMFDGFFRDLIIDEEFENMMLKDLETGIHINETDNPQYFTTAYFQTPQELKDEISAAGLQLKKLIGVEGFGWLINNLKDKPEHKIYFDKLLKIIRLTEENEDLIAISSHIIAVSG